MSIVSQIKPLVLKELKTLYSEDPLVKGFQESELTINITKPEFEGDYTLVLFSFVKQLKKSPEQLGQEIGEALVTANPELFTAYNVIKGFLNLTISDKYWLHFLQSNFTDAKFGCKPANGKKVMVEYSSPNTNKPIHLGHLRNNFLGWSVAQVLKESGYETIKSCIINDRGIHICKSMIAWQQFAEGATPQSTNTKGDHFVGEYYVRFNEEYKKQVEELIAGGMKKEEAEKWKGKSFLKFLGTSEVAVRPLSQLITEPVDLLTVDAEGMDLEVLQSYGWEHHPKAIVVEGDGSKQFLLQKGYTLYAERGASRIYTYGN